MGRVLTNNITLQYAIEATPGVLPGSPSWKILEPNTVSTIGANISTVPRDPISEQRQRRKGAITDLDSALEFDADLTFDSITDFVEAFAFATGVNKDVYQAVTAVSTTLDDYTVASLPAAVANKLEFVVASYASLIYARGFTNAANNGLKEIDADIAPAATTITVAENLVTEASPPANARIELAGVRSLAAAADLTWDWTAGTGTAQLISAADITDWTALGFSVGQTIHVGSKTTAGVIQNAFENSVANDMFGYARIVSMVAGVMTLDKVDTALQFDDLVAPATAVDILTGVFVRNVPVSNTTEFLERTFQFEILWPDLFTGPADGFSYSPSNYANSLQISFPLADKSTMTVGFIGTDTDNPTTVRKTNAASALDPIGTAAFNTTSDFARLRITDVDETGLTTDFKNITLTLNNNVSPEKVLGTLGAKFINTGNFNVTVEGNILFTEPLVVNRIRANTTVTMDFILTNSDGAIAVDLPSMTLGNGAPELPVNESVQLALTGEAFQDDTLGTSIGITIFSVPL